MSALLWKMEVETRYINSSGELGKTAHREIVEAENEQSVRSAFADRIRYSWQQILKVERLDDAPEIPACPTTETG